MLPASETGSFCWGHLCASLSPEPLPTRWSQHVEKGSVFWVCQWHQHKVLVPALYPPWPSPEQMDSPEAGQSGTVTWDASCWEGWGSFKVTCENRRWEQPVHPGRATDGCPFQPAHRPAVLVDLEKGVSSPIALLKRKISQGVMVSQGKHEQKCSSHTKIRKVVTQQHTALSLPACQKQVEII